MDKDILDTVVFETKWSWYDVLISLEDTGRIDLVKAFKEFSEEDQLDIISNCEHILRKCMETGIMNDWTIVMEAAIDMSGLINEITEKERKNNDYEYRMSERNKQEDK
jgi:hypothetical protein